LTKLQIISSHFVKQKDATYLNKINFLGMLFA
jgi:hypothetical protein